MGGKHLAIHCAGTDTAACPVQAQQRALHDTIMRGLALNTPTGQHLASASRTSSTAVQPPTSVSASMELDAQPVSSDASAAPSSSMFPQSNAAAAPAYVAAADLGVVSSHRAAAGDAQLAASGATSAAAATLANGAAMHDSDAGAGLSSAPTAAAEAPAAVEADGAASTPRTDAAVPGSSADTVVARTDSRGPSSRSLPSTPLKTSSAKHLSASTPAQEGALGNATDETGASFLRVLKHAKTGC